MASAVVQQCDQFRAAFKREFDVYLGKLEQPGERKDPDRLKRFKTLADSMADSITGRMRVYAHTFDLGAGPTEVEGERSAPRPNDLSSNLPLRTRLEALEAELQQRSEEEDRLRSEWMERQNASLRQCNVDVLRARQAALASDQLLEGGPSENKAEQLQRQFKQLDIMLSAAGSVASTLDKDRDNNRRIEEQCNRPLQYLEAELLLVPVGCGISHAVECNMQDGEAQHTSAEIERSQQVSRRMQRQFDNHA